MTVKGLKLNLAEMDVEERVAVASEDDSGLQFFEVADVSSLRGTPVLTPGGDAGCRFEAGGPANRTFIEVEKA